MGALRLGDERRRVARAVDRLQIDTRAQRQVRRLSGGNQQKVTIGRWLTAGFTTLLCFDPTRGIDIGTKEQIYRLLRELAAEGTAVLVYTSELAEVPKVCDRVVVLYGGRIVHEQDAATADETTLLSAMHGLPGPAGAGGWGRTGRSRRDDDGRGGRGRGPRRVRAAGPAPGVDGRVVGAARAAGGLVRLAAAALHRLRAVLADPHGPADRAAGARPGAGRAVRRGGPVARRPAGPGQLRRGAPHGRAGPNWALKRRGLGTALAVTVGILVVGALVQALVGLVVDASGVPDIVVTLAMSFVYSGLALFVAPSPLSGVPDGFRTLVTGSATGFGENFVPPW